MSFLIFIFQKMIIYFFPCTMRRLPLFSLNHNSHFDTKQKQITKKELKNPLTTKFLWTLMSVGQPPDQQVSLSLTEKLNTRFSVVLYEVL